MKYPRTYHLPYSPGTTSDDRIAPEIDVQNIIGKKIVITEKLDGSNSCITKGGVYARSHGTYSNNPWDRVIWEIHNRIKDDINDYYIFGENMYGIHSIEYNDLESYFYIFGVREDKTWLSFKEVKEIGYLLDLPIVPVLFEGVFNSQEELQSKVEELVNQTSILGGKREGIVVRQYDSFENKDFHKSFFKWVRKDHVKTDQHWTRNWKRAKLKWEK